MVAKFLRPADRLFPELARLRDSGMCPRCAKTVDPDGFKDELSAREFRISGLCQGCQDLVFELSGDE